MKNPVDGLPQSATAGALRTVELRVETKFLRLGHPVPVGSYFGDWRVYWLGGWDKHRVLFVVMVCRAITSRKRASSYQAMHPASH